MGELQKFENGQWVTVGEGSYGSNNSSGIGEIQKFENGQWITVKKGINPDIIKAQEEEKKALEDFKATQGGFLGTINRWLGRGLPLPNLANESPEYKSEKEASTPPTTMENLGGLVSGFATETYKDTVLQGGLDEVTQNRIVSNAKLINTALQKKKENPQKADFYDKFIQDRLNENKELSSQVGGEIKNKTNTQLVGQSLGTALDISNVILPFGALFKSGATFATKEGIKLTSKEVAKILAEKGIQATGKEATQALADLGITAAKTSIKKVMAEGGAYGSAYGLAGGLEQENATPWDVAKSTGVGAVAGATLAGLISGASGLFGKLVAKRATNRAMGIIEKEVGKLEPEEIVAVKEGIASGLSKEEIVTGLKKSRTDIETVFGKEPVETPKVETPKVNAEPTVEIKPVVSVKEQVPDLSMELNKKDYETILKSKIESVPEPKPGEVTVIQSGDGKTGYVDTQIDEALGRGINKDTKVFNVSEKSLSLTDMNEKNLRGERLLNAEPLQEGGKVSGVAKSIEAKAIEQGFIDKGYDELATFQGSTFKEQSEKISTLMSDDMEKFKGIIRGEIEKPSEYKSAAIISAAEDYIKKTGDKDLMEALANSKLASDISEGASETSFARMREKDSASARLSEVKKARELEAKVPEKKSGVVNKLKSESKKINIPKETLSWNNFLDSIKC